MIVWSLVAPLVLAVALPRLELAVAPPCPSAPPLAAASARALRLVVSRAPTVAPRDVLSLVAAAQVLWESHGVTLTIVAGAAPPVAELFARDEAALATSGLARAATALATAPGDPTLHRLVVLDRLAAPGAPLAAALGELDGLTLVPGSELARALGLGPGFGPVVFVGVDGWRRRRPADLDMLVAHELGHALGLGHATAPWDLMTPGPHRCRPWVDRAALRGR